MIANSLTESDGYGLLGVLIVFVVLGLIVGFGSSSGGDEE
jgi:hypothetical protein